MLRDPFTIEDEAVLYVPRAASERVLGELEQALRRGTHPVAVIGSVGIGKSLLFKVVAQRLAGHACCVPVSYEGWSVAELCQWVIRELDARETLEGERGIAHRPTLVKFREWMQRERSYLQKGDPESALLELAGDLQGRGFPIVLLVDDADSMKPDTAARLVELTAQSNGSLVLGLALTEGASGAGALRGALAPGLREIRFFEPMTLEETTSYIKERLAKAGASRELRACLDDSRIRRIYRYTEGNPRRVHGEVGLLHLELSRVRAGIAVREGDPARFEPGDELRPPIAASYDASAPVQEPVPSPWRPRPEPTTPAPAVDETEAVIAALTPLPEPTPEIAETLADVEIEEAIDIPLAVDVEPEPVAIATLEAAAEPQMSEPAEPALEDVEPVLEDLAELADGAEEMELEVVAIEELPAPAATEPPAAIPPAPIELATPIEVAETPAPAVEPETPQQSTREEEPEPHIIAPEMLASLRASAHDDDDEPAPRIEPPSVHVVHDANVANPDLYAAAKRDWEDLSQRSAPLASVVLPPPPAPVEPPAARTPPRENRSHPRRAPWAAAAGILVAAGLGLGLWLMPTSDESTSAPASSPSSGTTDVGAPPPLPAEPPPAPLIDTPAPAPTAAPSETPASNGTNAEPSMIATNINAKPWARIEIDGVDVGETPLGELMLREGKHSFKAFMSDGRIVERTETIARSNSRILFE
jgi:type II secretory pathway predicted ATPase ExeA